MGLHDERFRQQMCLVSVWGLTPCAILVVFDGEFSLVDVVELLVSDALFCAPFSVENVGFQAAGIWGDPSFWIMQESGWGGIESSGIVAIFVALEGMGIDGGIIEENL